jgi:hypothetical protein
MNDCIAALSAAIRNPHYKIVIENISVNYIFFEPIVQPTEKASAVLNPDNEFNVAVSRLVTVPTGNLFFFKQQYKLLFFLKRRQKAKLLRSVAVNHINCS